MPVRAVVSFCGLWFVLCVGAAWSSALPSYQAMEHSTEPPAAQVAHPADGIQDLGAALLKGLRDTPGCLGVELAQTISGKSVIFAWFEDKAAVKRWYYSDIHSAAMKRLFPDNVPGVPMAGVPDDVKPIMCIASITAATDTQANQSSMPIAQIAIELYTPVTGGLFLGGRFAPAEMKVKGMDDYTPLPMRPQRE